MTERTHVMRGVRIGAACAAVMTGIVVLFPRMAGAQDRAKIEAGEEVYSTYCSPCHGDELVNTGQTFDLRRLTANDRTRFQNSVLNGKNQMPPWKGALTDEQIDLLWLYIRDNAFQK